MGDDEHPDEDTDLTSIITRMSMRGNTEKGDKQVKDNDGGDLDDDGPLRTIRPPCKFTEEGPQ